MWRKKNQKIAQEQNFAQEAKKTSFQTWVSEVTNCKSTMSSH